MEFVEFLESKETSSVVVFALIDIADAAWKATTIFVKKKTKQHTGVHKGSWRVPIPLWLQNWVLWDI